MLFPPVPSNEADRLKVLEDLNILDTLKDQRFDFITQFAAQALKAPICLISLVDQDRQWFKSNSGLETRETSRFMSFCAHAISETSSLIPESRFFEINNTHADTRFSDNPLVINSPYVRSYIGYVLQAPNDINLGTLCVIDTKPRAYSSSEKELIRILATMAQNLINEDEYFPQK